MGGFFPKRGGYKGADIKKGGIIEIGENNNDGKTDLQRVGVDIGTEVDLQGWF